MKNSIRIIELWPKETNCQICWKLHYMDEYLPFYEDKIVDPEKTDNWAGQSVCHECYEKYERGELNHLKADDEFHKYIERIESEYVKT